MSEDSDSGVQPAPASPWQTWAVRLWPWAARGAALLVAVPALALLYYIFWARLSYPLDLEWMESGVLVTAKRAMDGHTLYAAPSFDYTSFCYPPLYPLLLGWLGKVVGLSYTLGRTVSVLAFTATMGIVARASLRGLREADGQASDETVPLERRSVVDALVYAVVAMAAVAVAYRWTGAWYDLVRIDSLFVALAVGGLYALAVGHRSMWGVIGAGVLLGLAFFAKQTAVLFIVAAGVAQVLLYARFFPVLVAVVGAVAGLGTLAYNYATDGWFWFFIYDLHQSHQTSEKLIWSGAPTYLWTHAKWLYTGGVAAVLLVGAAGVLRRRLPRHGLIWLLAALGGVAAAAVGRSTQWAYDNAYIPGVVFPALLVAVASAEARGLLALRPADAEATGWRASLLRCEGWLRAACWGPIALVLIQVLATGLPEPRRHVPDARTRRAARNLVSELKRMGREGEVMVPYHPYYNVIAGGRGHGHIMSVNDVNYTRKRVQGGLIGNPHRRRERVLKARRGLLRSVREAVGSNRYTWIIHDRNMVARWVRRGDRAELRPNRAYLAQLPGLVTHYRPVWDLAWRNAAPGMMSGNPAAPRYVWRRPGRAVTPSGARVVFDFEQRTLRGWTVEGTAFGRTTVTGLLWDPKRNRPQGLVSGEGGKRWVSSFHGGDAATGRLVSPSFKLDRPQLWLRLAGGKDPKGLVVRLRVDGQVVRQATGTNSEQMRTVQWDVRKWAERPATLEVVDAATGAWGHLQLDEVWLVND